MTKDQKRCRAEAVAETMKALAGDTGWANIECSIGDAPEFSVRRDDDSEDDGEAEIKTGMTAAEFVEWLAGVI